MRSAPARNGIVKTGWGTSSISVKNEGFQELVLRLNVKDRQCFRTRYFSISSGNETATRRASDSSLGRLYNEVFHRATVSVVAPVAAPVAAPVVAPGLAPVVAPATAPANAPVRSVDKIAMRLLAGRVAGDVRTRCAPSGAALSTDPIGKAPLICLLVRPSIRSFVRPFVRPAVRPFVRPVRPSVPGPSIHSPVRPFAVRQSIHPSVRPSDTSVR